MKWKDNKLDTIGDLMRDGIDKCINKEEAQEFMKLYRKENKFADKNIGYLSGYYSSENMRRIQNWFGVTHPVFGDRTPTIKEAIEAGKKMAENTNQ